LGGVGRALTDRKGKDPSWMGRQRNPRGQTLFLSMGQMVFWSRRKPQTKGKRLEKVWEKKIKNGLKVKGLGEGGTSKKPKKPGCYLGEGKVFSHRQTPQNSTWWGINIGPLPIWAWGGNWVQERKGEGLRGGKKTTN